MASEEDQDLCLCVAGESGDGILTAGELLARTLARLGYHTLTFPTYPAEIRGGPCAYRIRASPRPVHTLGGPLDALVALDRAALERHHDELKPDAVLCYEAREVQVEPAPPRTDLALSARRRVMDAFRSERPLNVYAVAALAAHWGLPREALEAVVRETFGPRGPATVDLNLGAVGLAYADAAQRPRNPRLIPPDAKGAREAVALNGNQAVVLGALAAQCRFFAGYPITPASPILDEMARLLPHAGGTCVQAEDEMAALGLCLGASFAGTRSMTATSGPGLGLMSELLGLAVMAELPVVVCNVQRAGPATGMPTRPEQGDLWAMIFGSPGEAPRVVIAPTDVADAYDATQWAFQTAETYQVPVILATDAYLASRVENVPRARLRLRRPAPPPAHGNGDAAYRRYRLSPTSISPRSLPGDPEGIHFAESLEHDETGAPSYEGPVHEAMARKRRAKLEPLRIAPEALEPVGAPDAGTVLVSWGGSCGAVREVAQARSDVSGLLVRLLEPLPLELLERVRAARRVLVVENNPSGQLALLLEAHARRSVERVVEARGQPVSAQRVEAALGLASEVAHV